MLIAFQQNNSSNGAVPDPSFIVKGLARETRSPIHVLLPDVVVDSVNCQLLTCINYRPLVYGLFYGNIKALHGSVT